MHKSKKSNTFICSNGTFQNQNDRKSCSSLQIFKSFISKDICWLLSSFKWLQGSIKGALTIQLFCLSFDLKKLSIYCLFEKLNSHQLVCKKFLDYLKNQKDKSVNELKQGWHFGQTSEELIKSIFPTPSVHFEVIYRYSCDTQNLPRVVVKLLFLS